MSSRIKQCAHGAIVLAMVAAVSVTVNCGGGGKTYNDKDLSDWVKNDTNFDAKSLTLKVEIEGAGTTFPTCTYETGGGYLSNPTITNTANNEFTLVFNADVESGQNARIVVHFNEKQKVKIVDKKWSDQPPASNQSNLAAIVVEQTYDIPGIEFVVEDDQTLGAVLRIINPSAASVGAVRFEELQWTATNSPISTPNLLWGDSTVEALPWQTPPITLPFELDPGESTAPIDIPDGSVIDKSYALVRYRTSRPSQPGDIEEEVIFQGEITDAVVTPVPGLSVLGAIALILLLVGAGARRRRRSVESAGAGSEAAA